MKTRNFLRLLSVILTLVICASLFAACNNGETPSEAPSETPEATVAETPAATTDPREEKYAKAFELIEKGDYEASYALFVELGDYKDAAKQASYFRYIPVSNCVKYTSEDESDTINYTVTLNEKNLPATVVEEYVSGEKHTCTYTYNELGHLIRRQSTDEEGNTSSYEATYDANGNRTSEIFTDKKGNVSKFDYTYNDKNQCIKLVTTNVPGYYSSCTVTYDEQGRESKIVFDYDGDISTEEYIYNEKGDILKMTWTDAEGTVSIDEYKYDEKGRLVEITFTEDGEDAGFRRKTYNDKDQVITQHVCYSFGYDFTYTYEYDEHGNIIKEIYEENDGEYSDVRESTYKLVYLPFEYEEDEWDEIYYSTMCWDWSHTEWIPE